MTLPLGGRRIVVPETRDLAVLARMLERYGAETIRCPLVAIRDHPDHPIVEDWLRRFAAAPPDDLILLTGEGLERLVAAARRCGLETGFIGTLRRVRKITRGPKPAHRLRRLGLKPDLAAEPATSAGIIALLAGEDLRNRRVAISLYPGAQPDLLDFLAARDARADPILAYVYASESEDGQVLAVIRAMAAGEVDLIAFTSSPQLRRLQEVAKAAGAEVLLAAGLRRTTIAAVGPVVARALADAGATVAMMPAANFHMKPMVEAILAALSSDPASV